MSCAGTVLGRVDGYTYKGGAIGCCGGNIMRVLCPTNRELDLNEDSGGGVWNVH